VNRRQFLAGTTLGLAALTGCADSESEPASPTQGSPSASTTATRSEPTPADGYPPPFDSRPARRELEDALFEPLELNAAEIQNSDTDVTVTLASIDAVHYWFRRREARFVDARSSTQYEQSHILGAVNSPANTNIDEPVAEWPTDDRIVTYCGCPHHLSSVRAAELQSAGYESVSVLDEGFHVWNDQYQIAGKNADYTPPEWTVDGQAARESAGRPVAVRHPETGQREVAPIEDDGSYQLHLRFYDITPETHLTLETPGYTVEAPVQTLADGVVTADR